MAGNTATIDVCQFRADWDSHVPMRVLCERYDITRDQVIRLKVVWQLPPRHDRKLRYKPKRRDIVDPTPAEIRARCAEIQARWDETTRNARLVQKPQAYTPPRVVVEPDVQEWVDQCNREAEW